ncbi:hypothetical protein [Aestuariivivens sediminis]|uniref:hypothetical protein n=1 Tax=Aestuariivivens sediminis TaxID=2913557 RepID=UPI001F589E64|nr:hypothetical protein [Aestuariivivens sediminis]
MGPLKEHMAFRIFTLLVIAALLTPTVVKFTHTFYHHTHKVCTGEKSTHLHKIDLDCELLKCHLHKNFTLSSFTITLFSEDPLQSITEAYYFFLSDYQRLHFSLRGPPQINFV